MRERALQFAYGWQRRLSVPLLIAILAAIGLAAVSTVRGTWAVGGSDSSCYGLMADALARGELQPREPMISTAPWPNAQLTFAPGGFIPSPVDPIAASPVCAPGFSLLLAPARRLFGRDGIFLVPPIAAAALVLATFAIGRHLGGPVAGAAAAVLVASSPIVIFQSVQPMNDITTTALIAGAVAMLGRLSAFRIVVAGGLAGVACLVRPNLAPIGAAMALWILTTSPRHVLLFALAASPSVLLVLWFNESLYGHPLRFGYGAASDLFSLSHVPSNVRSHFRALVETQLGYPLIGLLAPLVLREPARRFGWLSLAIAAVTVGIYLLYQPFAEWWYLRFLLPAVVLLTALASAAVVLSMPNLVRRSMVPVWTAIGVLVLSGHHIEQAVHRSAFDLQRLEGRFRLTGESVRDRLPDNAVLITVWQSGTVRYHAGRRALLWDSMDPQWLDRAVSWLRSQQRDPYILVERWEEPAFRQRFGGVAAIGNLDWPPRLEINRLVRIFSPADRDAYFAGTPVPTEHIWH